MSITQTFDLNLIPEQAPVVVHCDQYDEGTGRLIIKLFEGDVAYTPTGTASIQGRKPDGHGFQYSATLVGNTVTADLTFQMSCVSGRVRCQVVVTESTGRTGTFAFILDVQPSALPSDTDLSDSDYQLIEQALEAAEDAVEAAEDAEAWAVGERGGVPVDPSDPTYHNNSKYWSDQAASVGDLDDLNDVTITAPSNNQVLTYDSNSGEWVNANPQSVPSDLDDLNDVTITSAANGQVLAYDSNDSEWKNASLPTPDIDDLGDVTITSPSDGQALLYDAANQIWKNGNVSGGGSDYMGLYGMTEIQSSDGQGTTLLDLDQYTSVGNYFCNGKAKISTAHYAEIGLNTTSTGTHSSAKFLLYVRKINDAWIMQDLYLIHATGVKRVIHYQRHAEYANNTWTFGLWRADVDTGSVSPDLSPYSLGNGMYNVLVNNIADGDILTRVNGKWSNKPIGEATGLATINTTGATNTTGSTINAGTYFYLDGVLVRAKADIANGATFTLNTNYEVVTAGALNELKSTRGSITFNNTVNGWTANDSWVAKMGQLVFGAINLFSSTNTGTIPSGGNTMGTVPWRPKGGSCQIYLANCSNVTNGIMNIDTNGNITTPWGLSNYSGMRYMFSVQFVFFTDD